VQPVIVIVDDNRTSASVLSHLLKLDGCPSKPFFCGRDLFEFLDSGIRPELVILDMRMPQMNGLECLSRLRSNPNWQCIPVMIYSADFNAEQVHEAKRLGAQESVVKGSLPWDDLLSKIKRHIEKPVLN
jgi:CheY-like chemotaxis protein